MFGGSRSGGHGLPSLHFDVNNCEDILHYVPIQKEALITYWTYLQFLIPSRTYDVTDPVNIDSMKC